MDVIVVGAGPARVVAARRAAELCATTTMVTRDEFGGTAANDGRYRSGRSRTQPGGSARLASSAATGST